jgi:hypothetical protein
LAGVVGDFGEMPVVAAGLGVRPVPSAVALRGGVQPKLAVGAVDDPLEHEADRVAEQVMRMPDPGGRVSAGVVQVSRKCDGCREEEDKEKKESPVRLKASMSAGGAVGGEAPPIVGDVLGSSGRPLDEGSQMFFGPRFGRGFADIRIHTDATAVESARSVGALAYTAGRHIVFGAGQYAPSTSAGKALLAHELAHTVQQTHHTDTPPVVSRRVGAVTCPSNQFGAPADPRADLETADARAINLATQMAQGLAADAQAVRGGIPDPPSATLQAFEDHFGLPIASGTGFLNRMTGIVRASREIALSEELSVVSARFAAVARLMGQGLNYRCPGNAPLTLQGCTAGSCADGDAFSCPGNSLVALCQGFWGFDDTGRAQVLIHESLHIAFPGILDATTRGPGRNFNISGCYEALIADQTGTQTATCPDVPGP